MSQKNKLRVFCYDVSDDTKRRQIARLLEDNATRVQYSVFESRLSKAKTDNLTKRIQEKLEKGDSLRVYSVGKTGERHCTVSHKALPIERDVGFWLF